MPLSDSLGWQPELNLPPLYQLTLRAITSDPHPSEWTLRLPAAVCGVLLIAAGCWLGRAGGAWTLGCSLALLLACHPTLIRYAQEARGYSMMVLGCAVLDAVLVQAGSRIGTAVRRWLCGRDGTGVPRALPDGAHRRGPVGLVRLGVVARWTVTLVRASDAGGGDCGVAVRAHCHPLPRNPLDDRPGASSWIDPPTASGTLGILGELTFGNPWVFLLLPPTVALWALSVLGWRVRRLPRPGGELSTGPRDLAALLLAWLACAWAGLLVVSWLVQPAMLTRYALPAAVPALLFPMLIAYRLDRRSPLILAAVVALRAAPAWVDQATTFEPGFRELAAYVQEHVDSETEGVVLTIDNQTHPGWEDLERLPLAYYPLAGIDIQVLHLDPATLDPINPLLRDDPRVLYVIVFRANASAIVEKAGREVDPIIVDGESFDRLPFEPYRLVRVAAKGNRPGCPTGSETSVRRDRSRAARACGQCRTVESPQRRSPMRLQRSAARDVACSTNPPRHRVAVRYAPESRS